MNLEICCFNIASCLVAQASGADRVELCVSPADGGTTPSYGFIQSARQALSIELFPIIRPRGGDFLYDADEYAIMEKDIVMCKSLGCDGVVLGMLDADGRVDSNRVARLVSLAYPMEVTFHRAFDRAADAFEAMEAIIATGCSRILTSGQRPHVLEGIEVIASLVKRADDRIVIMPGAGLRSGNVQRVMTETGATEYHTTARMTVPSGMKYINEAMGEQLDSVLCSGEEIARIKEIIGG